MKKWLIPLIIIAVLAFAVFNWAKGFYNTTIQLNENVSESWGNVQTAYQRRNDLIGNLVKTVQGAADFEKETLTAVIEARAKATSVNVSADNLNPASFQMFQQKDRRRRQCSHILSRMLQLLLENSFLIAWHNFSRILL
ncbi:LemA family protein [Alteromonas abrolhosensis]|uniref:LemA family protein n=1 Tax=Alteromonas abrolhosensis TaxID=1892904 RepID=UPI003BAABE01